MLTDHSSEPGDAGGSENPEVIAGPASKGRGSRLPGQLHRRPSHSRDRPTYLALGARVLLNVLENGVAGAICLRAPSKSGQGRTPANPCQATHGWTASTQ